MITVVLTFTALLLPESTMAKATLTLEGASTDSTITISYVVPESSHVQVRIASGVGVHAAPQFGFQVPGSYTIVLDKSDLPSGKFSVQLIRDRDRDKVIRRGFLHSSWGGTVTWTKEEQDHWNRSFAVTSIDPEKAVDFWDGFFARYPNYANRGLAFVYSIMARIPATDSVDVHAAADSAIALLPHSGTYYTIGRILSGLDGLPDRRYAHTALAFADSAISQVADVPKPYRNEKLAGYHHLKGHCLQLLNRFEKAEAAYLDAIRILDSMDGSGTYGDFGHGVLAYRGLASLHEQQGRHGKAIEFYEKAVRSHARDPELWMALQRNFSLFHGSDEGYVDYSRKLEAGIRGDAREKDDDLVGKPLPGFVLPRLGGGTLSVEDIKGNVIVLNFWAFWCGPCMAELPVLARLANEPFASNIKVIAVHTPLEYYPGITKEEFSVVVRNAVSKYEGTFDTVWDSKEQNFSVRTGIHAIPVTLVADRGGIVRYRMVGFDPETAYRNLRAVVDRLSGHSATPR
ncbi:MAG: redoxin domain-containing protein [Gemmatimonadota bacterium]|nr:redoxin domain-containing protein [Gemmatimonadota bacterium]